MELGSASQFFLFPLLARGLLFFIGLAEGFAVVLRGAGTVFKLESFCVALESVE
jgi:hypothetical protein